jgi:hypothetical protein
VRACMPAHGGALFKCGGLWQMHTYTHTNTHTQIACLDAIVCILNRRSSTQEGVRRLEQVLEPVSQGRYASLLTTSNQPAVVSGSDGQDKISAESWAHTRSLISIAEVAENVEREAERLTLEQLHLCQSRKILQTHLRNCKQEQRAAERVVAASSGNSTMSSLLESERQRMEAEQSRITVLSGMDGLIAEIERYLARILHALGQLRGMSATRSYHDAARQLLLEVQQLDKAHEDAVHVGCSVPARLVRQQRLISGLHVVSDDCKYHALAFIQCLLALDSCLAQHAASNG